MEWKYIHRTNVHAFTHRSRRAKGLGSPGKDNIDNGVVPFFVMYIWIPWTCHLINAQVPD